MDCKSLITLLVISSLQVIGVVCFNLIIQPTHGRVTEDPTTVTITCLADAKLTGCQFMWRDERRPGPLIELSQEHQSWHNPSHLSRFFTGYRYNGRGLEDGECGITMKMNGVKVWIVGCRVHTDQGGWKYAWTDLFAHSVGLLQNNVVQRQIVVLPNRGVSLMLKAQAPIDVCHFYVPGVSGQLNFDKGVQSADSIGRHHYFGTGLEVGECGLALHNVSEANNGPARCYVRDTRATSDDYTFIALVIARPPSAPVLQAVYEDTSIVATCYVQNSRPVPSIAWRLGDEIIRQDSIDDTPADHQDEWRWPWNEKSIMQNITRRLQPQDDGKMLRCVVSHPTLMQPLESSKRITFIRSKSVDSPSSTNFSTIPGQLVATGIKSSFTTTSNNARASPTVEDLTTITASPNKMLDMLCQQHMMQAASELQANIIPKDEIHEFRVREASAAATAAELLLEAARSHASAEASRAVAEEARAEEAKLLVEVAKSRAKAEDSRAMEHEAMAKAAELAVEAAELNVKTEELRAFNSEEDLHSERDRLEKQERGYSQTSRYYM